MGVQDYQCYLCGEPLSYPCQTSEGDCPGDCKPEGIGNDKAFLSLYHFPRDAAPASSAELLSKRSEALRREDREFEYDWDMGDFMPNLDYCGFKDCCDDDDEGSVWRLNDVPNEDDEEEEICESGAYPPLNEIEIEQDPSQTIWVENHCPTCHHAFVQGNANEKLCRVYLKAIADKHGLQPTGDDVATVYKNLLTGLKESKVLIS